MSDEGATRWSDAIEGRHPSPSSAPHRLRIGVLPGEGIGPEVVAAALRVLAAAEPAHELTIEEGPAVDPDREASGLPEPAAEFCRDTFAAGGAVLAGPHGGRWVYELRARFDLFCKISPLQPATEIDAIEAPISPRRLDGVDILVVREQAGGIYQGRWGAAARRRDGRIAEHSFAYSQREVHRILTAAATLARWRCGRLAMVVKDGGIPSVSGLWREVAGEVAGEVELEVLDIDYAVYRLLRDPRSFDVIVAPNMLGDVLSDAGGALLGSRGITFAGSFDDGRAAVYQTNHGAAHDLAGTDRANPAGQILSAAMMLRESFGMTREAEAIERSLRGAWGDGWRTEDVAEPGCRVIGAAEMGERVTAGVGLALREGDREEPEARAPR